METLQCSRCPRVAMGDDEHAGSWFVVAGSTVCPSCQTLEDLVAAQNEHDAVAGQTICPGCGRLREPDEFWRGYLLAPAQVARCLVPPGDPTSAALICSDCEQQILLGVAYP
jgi:hypothetical protein